MIIATILFDYSNLSEFKEALEEMEYGSYILISHLLSTDDEKFMIFKNFIDKKDLESIERIEDEFDPYYAVELYSKKPTKAPWNREKMRREFPNRQEAMHFAIDQENIYNVLVVYYVFEDTTQEIYSTMPEKKYDS